MGPSSNFRDCNCRWRLPADYRQGDVIEGLHQHHQQQQKVFQLEQHSITKATLSLLAGEYYATALVMISSKLKKNAYALAKDIHWNGSFLSP